MNTRSLPVRRTCVAVVAGAVALPFVATPAAATGTEVGGSGATYYLTNTNDPIGTKVVYGQNGDKTYVGDWNGDGRDTLAVRRGSTFHLKNQIAGGAADRVVSYGTAADDVLVGDWDGDGVDTFAVRRGNVYHVSNSLEGGKAEQVFAFGAVGDEVLVGDWNGDGRDTLAVRRGSEFHLLDSLRSGEADRVVSVGDGRGDAVAGSWGGGADGVGIRVGNQVKMRHADGTVVESTYGRSGDAVFIGDWDGDGVDTLGVRRPAPKPAARVAAKPGPSAQSTSSANAAMSTARSKLGSGYRYAASGPNVFDCSGFTSYVYRSVGLELPRNSSAQRNWAASNGRQVPMSQAKPGDLLWWPGHVGIYAGNGRVIDAGSPATGVSERRIWGNPQVFRVL